MPKKDFSQIAFAVVQQATGEAPKPASSPKRVAKQKAGIKGGASRATKLTDMQRSEIAQLAAQARWKKTP